MSDFQLFIDAIKSEKDEQIEKLFKIDFLEMKDENSWRPLHHACYCNRVKLVKLLLSHHCEIDSRLDSHHQQIDLASITSVVSISISNDIYTSQLWGYHPIHLACVNGHIDIVKILIANKCDINASSEDGFQPIHLACIKGDIDIVKILIDNKCDINACEKVLGYQPIHLASDYGHIDIVKILIANKCDINVINKLGYQPIHLAYENDHIDIVKILIANKCDINAADDDGYQPIHLASEYGDIDIVKILIANKCGINVINKFGYQPIHLACENGHIDVVKILIDNKCDINAADYDGYQPIHLACQNGHIDVVKILIANKCDINAADYDRYRPIHLACDNGDIDVVKILIDNNCDMNALTIYGESPIDIARKKGHQQIINIINAANQIKLIAIAMDLHCKIDCDHTFCRKSLEDEALKKGELIGSGSFGKVYKYKISNTNREIVIKQTKNNCEDKKNIEGNINKYSSRILHRNIVRYFGALEKSGKLCIYMEYIPGKCLKNLIDKSKWIEHSKVIKFSKEILNGLQFIHSLGIIHRDIKPENMLLDHDETLKLTDFGWSKSLRIESISETTTKTETFCGTSNYMAPEILLGEPYDFPADIWSTGASIIHMITGKIPYHWLRAETGRIKIATTKKIEFTALQPISEIMQLFINDLLTPEQSDRPNAESLLKHSIFKGL